MNQAKLEQLNQLCLQAGEAIMAIYQQQGDINVQAKADSSPLTEADLAAHRILSQGLPSILADTPILSEEGELPSFTERQSWQRYWLVDPLDGTKEFINRNGEFTVNVALIENGRPIAGVVYIPVQNIGYSALTQGGQSFATKWQGQDKQTITSRSLSGRGSTAEPMVVVGSRRHGAEALDSLIERLKNKMGQVELQSMGSSLKLCLVAEGQADLYPRLAPTCEWDTAAAHAIVMAAGGEVYGPDLQPLQYNQKDSLLNPNFYVVADPQQDWAAILAG